MGEKYGLKQWYEVLTIYIYCFLFFFLFFGLIEENLQEAFPSAIYPHIY